MDTTGLAYLIRNKDQIYKLNNQIFSLARTASAEYLSTVEATVGMVLEKLTTNPEEFQPVFDAFSKVLEEGAKNKVGNETLYGTIERLIKEALKINDKAPLGYKRISLACLLLSLRPESNPIFHCMEDFIAAGQAVQKKFENETKFYTKQCDTISDKHQTHVMDSLKAINELVFQCLGAGLKISDISFFKKTGIQ